MCRKANESHKNYLPFKNWQKFYLAYAVPLDSLLFTCTPAEKRTKTSNETDAREEMNFCILQTDICYTLTNHT